MKVDDGKDLLRNCENQLRGLVADAVAHGDYDSALELTHYARGIADLMANARVETPVPTANTEHGFASTKTKSGLNGKKTSGKGSRRQKEKSYPKFAKSTDDLIKIGWSKKDKSEYVHKAPRQVVNLLVDRLLNLRMGPVEIFTTEDIFPLRDESNGAEVPTYQSYLALAWLRSVGLIAQHGRQGYSIRETENPHDLVSEKWNDLPRHRK